ncbi:hotdog fold thioesterase [Cohnella sp. CFH 77786]|uniref:hotdog fold thioesterase n=1 Tax=Cohnella sp. CFH 77786 TaxID=2662265 RepID=UPI001C60E550|nr:hotdog fold thioesterase [Cohnella sp. CFH 77786]MBW5446441.1 hotdog fold thioesterase [Cohnella sp. CFH 77786]
MEHNHERFLLQDEEHYQNTMFGALGMRMIEVTPDCVVATMPVNAATRQYFGVLHGGASVALAETVASVGTYHQIDKETQVAVGMEINANHLRSKKDGIVTATATPFHKGRTTMVWDIRITDEDNRLICISRCTVAIVPRQNGK